MSQYSRSVPGFLLSSFSFRVFRVFRGSQIFCLNLFGRASTAACSPLVLTFRNPQSSFESPVYPKSLNSQQKFHFQSRLPVYSPIDTKCVRHGFGQPDGEMACQLLRWGKL